MILEHELEKKFIDALSAELGDDTIQFISSRMTTEVGEILEEKDDVDTIVVVGTGFRSHDSFSLSQLQVNGVVTIVSRVETDPTGNTHETIVEKIANLMSRWHKYGTEMCDALTTDKFIVSALKLDGGTGRVIDRSQSIFTDSIQFSVLGTELF